jgi:GNAT superfamily N-acetyltransferase
MADTPGAAAEDVVLRAALPADGDDVAALLGQLGYPCDHADATTRILAVAEDRRQALVVAVEPGGAVRGLLAMHAMYSLARGADVVRITALVVADQARGRGIGRLLLREAERLARAGDAERLEISSGSHRTDAHAFYRGCGFAESGLRFVKPLGD